MVFEDGDFVVPVKPNKKFEKEEYPTWVDEMDKFNGKLCKIVKHGYMRYVCLCRLVESNNETESYWFKESWLTQPTREGSFMPAKEFSSLLKRGNK